MQQGAEGQASDTATVLNSPVPSPSDTITETETEAEIQARAFLHFRTEYLTRYAQRVAGPLGFDSIFGATPRLDTLWVNAGEYLNLYSKSVAFGDTMECWYRRQNEGERSWNVTNISINGRMINTWPATTGIALSKWTKFYLHGKPWWCFTTTMSPNGFGQARYVSLLFINEQFKLFFGVWTEGNGYVHFNSPGSQGFIRYDTFVIVDYDHNSIPEYYATSLPRQFPLTPETIWKYKLYRLTQNNPAYFYTSNGKNPGFQILPYFTFSNSHSYTHSDSVIILRP